mmetsp:Transcript_51457/g.129245  ORF Transcript_51457/g.129245 Transcript_51457/m.129245 type:complete len:241 (-) Transcript_51457:359-1081(-)
MRVCRQPTSCHIVCCPSCRYLTMWFTVKGCSCCSRITVSDLCLIIIMIVLGRCDGPRPVARVAIQEPLQPAVAPSEASTPLPDPRVVMVPLQSTRDLSCSLLDLLVGGKGRKPTQPLCHLPLNIWILRCPVSFPLHVACQQVRRMRGGPLLHLVICDALLGRKSLHRDILHLRTLLELQHDLHPFSNRPSSLFVRRIAKSRDGLRMGKRRQRVAPPVDGWQRRSATAKTAGGRRGAGWYG